MISLTEHSREHKTDLQQQKADQWLPGDGSVEVGGRRDEWQKETFGGDG